MANDKQNLQDAFLNHVRTNLIVEARTARNLAAARASEVAIDRRSL